MAGPFSFSKGTQGADDFEKKFAGFKQEAATEVRVLEEAFKQLRQGVRLVRRIKRAEIKDMRIRRREGKEDRKISHMIEDIRATILKCNQMAARLKSDQAIPLQNLNDDELQRFYMELQRHMKAFEVSQEELEKQINEAIEDVNELSNAQQVEIGLNASVEKIEAEGLAQIDGIGRQLTLAQHRFNVFFERRVA